MASGVFEPLRRQTVEANYSGPARRSGNIDCVANSSGLRTFNTICVPHRHAKNIRRHNHALI